MIGVVVIGRNEGERLGACLASLAHLGAPVVYVDSGSTDGSLALATSFGARVTRLDLAGGFTAARGRNEGFATFAKDAVPPRYVQFIDGDCVLVPGWIEAAIGRLESDPNLAVVAGRRNERDPKASIFNRLCDMEWNTSVGPAEAVGGDAMYRADAFTAVCGFNGALICGEEPELCLRLRRHGWRIERLDADMTLHDAAMMRWSQWFRRTVRGGWAFAEGAAMHGAGPERYGRRAVRSIFVWGAGVPLAALSAGILAAMVGAPPTAVILTTVVPLWAWPAMALRIALRRRASHGDSLRRALLYGAMTMLGKIPELVGLLRYAAHRQRGGRAALIEYKV